MARAVLGVAAMLALSAGASRDPSASPPATLTVRNAHAMALDAKRGRIVLFGGADAERVHGDTWEWDGKRWSRVSTTGPAARTFPSLAYDSVRHVTLLFGGNRVLFGSKESPAVFLNDLWQWDGKEWRELQATGPSPRAEAAFAFDDRRGRAVLFGGYRTADGATVRLGDTWEWDGLRWSEVSTTGPSPRNGASLAYDRARDRMVLFGGRLAGGGGAETWEWDGNTWKKIDAALTDGRFNPAMAYDDTRRRIVRFGGWNGKERTGDTWEYDGRAWRRLATTGPPARNHSSLVFDRRRQRAVLFGGHDGTLVFGDLWEWDGRWRQRTFTDPQPRVDNGH